MSFPKSYPGTSAPCVSVTSDCMTRSQQSKCNEEVQQYMSTLELGEMVLLNIITYLQENILKFHTPTTPLTETELVDNVPVRRQMCAWFYIHHIYSKDKRRCIQKWAGDLGLTGFLMPGKPGLVHVEGEEKSVNDYYDRLKGLNWQKMTCKVMEEREERIFESFEEIFFEVHGTRSNHMDMGKLFVYLKEKGLGRMFKELFGVDGHN